VFTAIATDLRYAARTLGRSAGFTTAAVLTLALGIGATTAVFSVVYGVILRPLPFPNADRLVQIIQLGAVREGQAERARLGATADQITEWRATSRTLTHIGSYGQTAATLTDVPTPVRLNGASVSVTLFRALGVGALMGRTFLDEDEEPGAVPVAILGFRTWRTHFGAAEDVLQRTITLNGRAHRVVGVMPEGFGFPSLASPSMSLSSEGELNHAPEFWTPRAATPRPAGPATGGITMMPTFALLAPGVTLEQAAAEANTLMPARARDRFEVVLVSPRVERTRAVRPILFVFQGAVLFVLFIACVNVVNLLLARAAARRHELMVRVALGARRLEMVRYSLAEGVLIALGGGTLGCALAYGLIAAFRTLPPFLLPRMDEVQVDGTVLASATAVSIVAGLLVGVVSAVRVGWSERASGSFTWPTRTSSADRGHRPSQLLLVAEVAAGVVLLTGATLLLTSFVKLSNVDRGFRSSDVQTFRTALPSRSQSAAAQHAFHDRLIAELSATAGVMSVAASDYLLAIGNIGFSVGIEGQPKIQTPVAYNSVTPDLFRTLGIPLQGREISATDRGHRATVAIVNDTFARQFFGNVSPIGRHIQFQDWADLEIIGVTGDTRMRELQAPVRPAIYLPHEQERAPGNQLYVVRAARTAPIADAVRAAVGDIDSQAVVYDFTEFDRLLARTLVLPGFYATTATTFGVIAVVLAALGLYGILAYSVGSQTREFGIRLALGASRKDVIVKVMREVLATVLLGLAIGVVATLYLSRFVETLLYGVLPREPVILAAVVAMFLLVAAGGSFVPARRATRVDPAIALRAE
jgi:putative ABC transport system permease protein